MRGSSGTPAHAVTGNPGAVARRGVGAGGVSSASRDELVGEVLVDRLGVGLPQRLEHALPVRFGHPAQRLALRVLSVDGIHVVGEQAEVVFPRLRVAGLLHEEVDRLLGVRVGVLDTAQARLDKIVVFRALTPGDLGQILDIELSEVQNRVLASQPGRQFMLRCTSKAKDFLLARGTDSAYGARHLKRAIERHLVYPLSNLMATGQIGLGDTIKIDCSVDGEKLTFSRERVLAGRAGESAGGGLRGRRPSISSKSPYEADLIKTA